MDNDSKLHLLTPFIKRIAFLNQKAYTLAQLGCRQVVRQRILIPPFVGSNPATPAKTDKSLEIAAFSLFYKHLYWSVYRVFQKALFSALHGLTFQKSLCFQCFCLGMLKIPPKERQMYSD